MDFLQLNLAKPCSENWNNMEANEKGRFCDVCSKTVIDFTKLSNEEIIAKISKSNQGICARVAGNQLDTPLITMPSETESAFIPPYSKVAASLLIASSLMLSSPAEGSNKTNGELIELNDSNSLQEETANKTTTTKSTKEEITLFTGKITAIGSELPLENAVVHFFTLHKVYKAHSQSDGTFSLEIPTRLIDDKNLVFLSFALIPEVSREGDLPLTYESQKLILSKEEIQKPFSFDAEESLHYAGGLCYSRKKVKPTIIVDGRYIKYKDYERAVEGKKSKVTLTDKTVFSFYGDHAEAIDGKKHKDGMYIYYSK